MILLKETWIFDYKSLYLRKNAEFFQFSAILEIWASGIESLSKTSRMAATLHGNLGVGQNESFLPHISEKIDKNGQFLLERKFISRAHFRWIKHYVILMVKMLLLFLW